MANRSYNYRRHTRYIKGIKRVRADRAEHGDIYWIDSKGEPQLSCDCFCPNATHGKGAVFARFADYPKYCSCYACGGWKRWENWEKDHANKVPLGLDDE